MECEVVSHCDFLIGISLMNNMLLLAICIYSSFFEVSVQVFCLYFFAYF